MNFQELSESERAALKQRAESETLIELWQQLLSASSEAGRQEREQRRKCFVDIDPS